jgi:hypothetical protein
MESEIRITRKRGRPFGHKLSEETKERIRQRRLGTKHSQETKDKISQSLIRYFKSRDTLSDSMQYEYSYISEEATDWVQENKDEIDETEHVMTERRLHYLKQLEICLGGDIEHIFGHNATPEFLMLLKEEVEDSDRIEELHSLI